MVRPVFKDFFEVCKVVFWISAAVVGLERTAYRVVENVTVFEVCAVVYSPQISCPIEFPFTIALSTRG